MQEMITSQDILRLFPIREPYRFLDSIHYLDGERLSGICRFPPEAFFYRGHFPGNPVTPGSVIQETAAQAVLAFGMYLLGNRIAPVSDIPGFLSGGDFPVGQDAGCFYLVQTELSFKKIILPGETVTVEAEKVFFRLNKLKCKVMIKTEDGSTAMRGIISGIVIKENLPWQDGL